MDRSAPSISRQLVIAVAVPLLLSFALTIVVLDSIFRDSAMRALRERLDQEIVSLVTAAELTDAERMDLRVLDPESRLSRRRSGQYAAVRAANGHALWISPSLADLPVNFGPPVGKGQTSFFTTKLADGTVLGILNRGLEWEYAQGNSAELVFSVAEDLAGQDARLRHFRRQLCVWFGGLALLLLAVLGALLRRVSRPVRRLEQEIAEVDSGQRAQLGEGLPARTRRRCPIAQCAAGLRAAPHPALSRHPRQSRAHSEDAAHRDPHRPGGRWRAALRRGP